MKGRLTAVSIAAFFINYADEVAGYKDSKSSKLLSAAQGMFTLGRFLCTLCMKWIDAKYILVTFVSALVVLSALASGIGGTGGVILYMALFFFERFPLRVSYIDESLCFPTIFTLGLVGLGKYTKRGAGVIIQSIIGGACLPPGSTTLF